VLTTLALGKFFFENFFAECPSAWHSANKFFFLKKSLLSAHHSGTQQFLCRVRILYRVLTILHSPKIKVFLKKFVCQVPLCLALGKEKRFF
jgi:hypothetical protein